MAQIQQSGSYFNKTSTGNIGPLTAGTMIGFYVNSTSSGTLVLRDGGSGGTVVTGTITPAVGFHCFPAAFTGTPHVTISNTLDVTFFFSANS